MSCRYLIKPGKFLTFGDGRTNIIFNNKVHIWQRIIQKIRMNIYLFQEGRLARGEDLEKKGADEDEIKPDSDLDSDLKNVKGKKKGGFRGGFQAAKSAAHKLSPQMKRKKTKSSVALMKVYPNELEEQPEFHEFSEWLQTFELYRGKQADEIFDDESRCLETLQLY